MVDLDVDKMCRVCLRTNLELSLLFDEQNAVDGVCLSEMITECTMYTVRRHDEFPHLICYDCIDKVRGAYCFKKQFETSHRTLISWLDSANNITVDTKPSADNEKCTQTEESTMYPCEKCDEKFLNYERLREHRLTSHKGTANLCRICLKTFNRIGDLKNHIAICHPEIGYTTANECPVCNKKFTRKDHVTRHVRNVHKLGLEDAEDDGASEMRTDEIENLVETEIEFGNLTNQGGDVELLSNYDPEDYVDSITESPELEATNPFSSDDDEKPLSQLRITTNADAKDLAPLVLKFEPEDAPNINYSPDALKSDDQGSENKKKTSSAPLQDTTKRKFKCSECDKAFTRSSHVKRHLMSHSQEKPFPCTVCEKRFSRADHLKTHLGQHDTDKPHQCDSCDRTYARSDLLRRHKEHKHNGERSAKSEVCEHCNKAFSSKNYLHKHMRLHTEKSWKCKWCPLEFESKESQKEHTKTHDKERSYLCSECGLRFVRNDYLLVHMRRHNGEKPYKCKYCGKGFPRATDLNVHERYHTGEKSHLCTTCGKGFHRAYNLVVHMRVHTGEKPYQCPHCPKNFAQCNDLKAHVRRHTGERFKCEICGSGFIQGYGLTQHKLLVHGIEVEARVRRLTKFSSNDLNQKVTQDVLNESELQIKSEPIAIDPT